MESICELDYPDVEILVVDNGSTDYSVMRLRSRFPWLTIIETGENLGFSGGCNKGIEFALESGADYIWLLNNDAVAGTDALSEMIVTAESDTNIGGVGCLVRDTVPPYDIQAWGGGVVNLWTGTNRNITRADGVARITHLYGASILLRSSALRTVGLLDAGRYFMFWDENDLCLRLTYAGWRLAVCEKAEVFHEGSASVGKASTKKYLYFSCSAVHFFCLHAPIPLIPLGLGCIRSTVKFILTGRFGLVSAVWFGYRKGLKELAERRRLRFLIRGEFSRGR